MNLARLCFGERDKLSDSRHSERRRHHHNIGKPHHAGHWRAVPQEYEWQIFVERVANYIVGSDKHNCVTVSWRVDNLLRCNHAARTDAILDHARLAKIMCEPFAHYPSHGIGRTSCREAHDKFNWTTGEFFGGEGRRQRQAGEKAKQQDHKTKDAHHATSL